MRYLAFLLSLGLAIGCKPKEQPVPPSDSTVVTPPDTARSTTNENDPPLVDEVLSSKDTIITAKDSAARRNRPRGLVPGGVPVGLNKAPADQWCSLGLTGTFAAFSPRIAAGVIRKAEFCGVKIVGVMPRAQINSTGSTSRGYFVLSKGKQACDNLARALGSLVNSPNYDAEMVIDEPVADSWSRPTSAADVAEYTRYCQTKLTGVEMMVRYAPSGDWIKSIALNRWPQRMSWYAQWNKKRGPRNLNGAAKQKAYYDQQYNALHRLNTSGNLDHRLIVGFSARDIEGANSNVYASPTEVRTHGEVAALYSITIGGRVYRNCIMSAWWYEDKLWNSTKGAWLDVVNIARSHPEVSCRRDM